MKFTDRTVADYALEGLCQEYLPEDFARTFKTLPNERWRRWQNGYAVSNMNRFASAYRSGRYAIGKLFPFKLVKPDLFGRVYCWDGKAKRLDCRVLRRIVAHSFGGMCPFCGTHIHPVPCP